MIWLGDKLLIKVHKKWTGHQYHYIFRSFGDTSIPYQFSLRPPLLCLKRQCTYIYRHVTEGVESGESIGGNTIPHNVESPASKRWRLRMLVCNPRQIYIYPRKITSKPSRRHRITSIRCWKSSLVLSALIASSSIVLAADATCDEIFVACFPVGRRNRREIEHRNKREDQTSNTKKHKEVGRKELAG